MALEQLGFVCVASCEIDKHARKAYKAIYGGEEPFYADVRDIDPRELPDFDLLVGGFPCQAFSVAGKRGGFNDTRGTLFFELARIAKEKQPRLLLFENVKGLLSHDQGRTFGTILNTLDELGYDCEWQLCNSKDFGVPQNRERVYIVGHSRGGRARKVFPLRRENTETNCILVGKLALPGKDQWNRVYSPEGLSPTLVTMQGGRQEPKIAVPVLTPEREKKRQNGRRFKENGEPMFTLTAQDRHGVLVDNHQHLVVEYDRKNGIGKALDNAHTLNSSDWRGLNRNQKQNAVLETNERIAGWVEREDRIFAYQGDTKRSTAQEHVYIKPNGKTDALTVGHVPKMIRNYRIRKLTPRECWRLQGFPDWAFDRAKAAGISDTQLYKQAGNAVTVNVVYEIGKRLF